MDFPDGWPAGLAKSTPDGEKGNSAVRLDDALSSG
jgi:hypothetical protein